MSGVLLLRHLISAPDLLLACDTAGIDARTLQRWQLGTGLVAGDGRPQAVRPDPAHALGQAECEQVLCVANEPRFAGLPPARIAPMLAEEGVYIASESTFCRVLREHGQAARRGRAKPLRPTWAPTTRVATAPGQVWCWDMTYVPLHVAARWFYLYLIQCVLRRLGKRKRERVQHVPFSTLPLRRSALTDRRWPSGGPW